VSADPHVPAPGVSGPVGPHVAMPHIRAARQCLDVQSTSAEAMARYAGRASAHALVAIAVLLSGMQPCPLEPLPAPGVDFTKPPTEQR
jgi:hypothetical protein